MCVGFTLYITGDVSRLLISFLTVSAMAGVTPFLRAQLRSVFLGRSLGSVGEARVRSFSQPAPVQRDSSKPLGYPWRVVVAVCVQRLPTLSRETADIERRYQQLKDQLRVERSVMSDHELEEREHARKKREMERQALEDDVLTESMTQNEIEEFEELLEAREQELSAFQATCRSTSADRTNDLGSVQRQLDKMLYLLVKKGRSSHSWQMPQGAVVEGESLLQSARRELSEDCGSELRVDFLSSTPSAYFSYLHTVPDSPGIIGSKVFFLKARCRGGDVQLNQPGLVDHVWLTKSEMKDYVTEDYYQSVASTLID